MARREFTEMADHLGDLVDAIRAQEVGGPFGLKELLPEVFQVEPADHDKIKKLGWQLRELVRVFQEVEFTQIDAKGDAEYHLMNAIEERSRFDGGRR